MTTDFRPGQRQFAITKRCLDLGRLTAPESHRWPGLGRDASSSNSTLCGSSPDRNANRLFIFEDYVCLIRR